MTRKNRKRYWQLIDKAQDRVLSFTEQKELSVLGFISVEEKRAHYRWDFDKKLLKAFRK